MGKQNIKILDAKEQEGMRKVCRLAREVLDIAAAEVKPGVTTDYLDEVVHKACVERDVRLLKFCNIATTKTDIAPVISINAELRPLPQIGLHISQRSHLPRYTRSKSSS